MTTKACVGAQFLDEQLPTWYSLIDLTKLDLKSGQYCILGQLEQHIPEPDYDLYDEAIQNFDLPTDKYDIALIKFGIEYEAHDLGFTMFGSRWDELQQEWIEEINNRLNKV